MLSMEDLERLIEVKKREIDQEKSHLGLSSTNNNVDENGNSERSGKKARVSRPRALSENNVPARDESAGDEKTSHENEISPDLERYIRRYVGLPAMLKAGEYSPNNPLIRGERTTGDVLLGLGEYERRRNTFRKIRQRQYKEYLDQQAKKKQEAKEQAERERKEREEKERLREEREKERLELERINSPERRRASISHSYVSGANNTYITKVDTGVQVDHRSTPLSVAVQTDDDALYRLTPSPAHNLLTQAERELSPHTVGDGKQLPCSSHQWDWKTWDRNHERRRSYGDYDERTMSISKKPHGKLTSDLRHTYMPSIFDADAIRLRNEQAEKEAAERRQFYQKELKDQILEQQRIKEERKSREKMLEQAEMRRLEEQLRSLKMAQEREIDRQHEINSNMKDSAIDYDRKRTTLQKEIDLEHQALLKAAIHPKRNTHTSQSESPKHTNLPFFYKMEDRPMYTSASEKTMFAQNYDVESYLRKNLNPTQEFLYSNNNNEERKSNKIENRTERNIIIEKALVHENPKEIRKLPENFNQIQEKYKEVRKMPDSIVRRSENFPEIRKQFDNSDSTNENYMESRKITDNMERIHENFKDIRNQPQDTKKLQEDLKESRKMHENIVRAKMNEEKAEDALSIPILRHSAKPQISFREKASDLSEKMQMVDDKWKVPAVQKNILRSLPNEKGKNVSILTQLGSIRRQLQLEQMKLDKMLSKTHD